MSTVIDERTVLDSLRQIPTDRWGEVLRFLATLVDVEPTIRTVANLNQSGLVGLWAGRDDLGATSVQGGQDLVSFWRSEGLIGSRPEIDDSQAQAQLLREQAQRHRP